MIYLIYTRRLELRGVVFMQKFIQKLKTNRELLLLAMPGAIWFLIFAYLPMFGVIIAFKRFRISGGFIKSLLTSDWVWFDNFKFLFKSSDAWVITRNTVAYNAVFIILGILIPVCIALALNAIRNKRLAKFYQSAMFLPYFLSWVVVSYCLYAFLSPEQGYINSILEQYGREGISWYMEPKYWPYIIVFMSMWKGIGYNTVIYLASICGIDQSYYEAAMLDGASKWQQVKHITVPLLKPVIIILFILSIGKIFNADFGLFYQLPMNAGPLYPVTNVIDTYVYRALMTMGEIGMSSAAGLYQSVVGLILIVTTNKIVSKIDSDNALF